MSNLIIYLALRPGSVQDLHRRCCERQELREQLKLYSRLSLEPSASGRLKKYLESRLKNIVLKWSTFLNRIPQGWTVLESELFPLAITPWFEDKVRALKNRH